MSRLLKDLKELLISTRRDKSFALALMLAIGYLLALGVTFLILYELETAAL